MKETYWNSNGKYQRFLDALNRHTPTMGYTTNPRLNLLILAQHMYYDVYSNGAGNIATCQHYLEDIEYYVLPFNSEFKGINFEVSFRTILKNLKNEEKLEQWMDSVIACVWQRDLSYDKFPVYCHHETRQLSGEPREDFELITFGNLAVKESWVNSFLTYHSYQWIEESHLSR